MDRSHLYRTLSIYLQTAGISAVEKIPNLFVSSEKHYRIPNFKFNLLGFKKLRKAFKSVKSREKGWAIQNIKKFFSFYNVYQKLLYLSKGNARLGRFLRVSKYRLVRYFIVQLNKRNTLKRGLFGKRKSVKLSLTRTFKRLFVVTRLQAITEFLNSFSIKNTGKNYYLTLDKANFRALVSNSIFKFLVRLLRDVPAIRMYMRTARKAFLSSKKKQFFWFNIVKRHNTKVQQILKLASVRKFPASRAPNSEIGRQHKYSRESGLGKLNRQTEQKLETSPIMDLYFNILLSSQYRTGRIRLNLILSKLSVVSNSSRFYTRFTETYSLFEKKVLHTFFSEQGVFSDVDDKQLDMLKKKAKMLEISLHFFWYLHVEAYLLFLQKKARVLFLHASQKFGTRRSYKFFFLGKLVSSILGISRRRWPRKIAKRLYRLVFMFRRKKFFYNLNFLKFSKLLKRERFFTVRKWQKRMEQRIQNINTLRRRRRLKYLKKVKNQTLLQKFKQLPSIREQSPVVAPIKKIQKSLLLVRLMHRIRKSLKYAARTYVLTPITANLLLFRIYKLLLLLKRTENLIYTLLLDMLLRRKKVTDFFQKVQVLVSMVHTLHAKALTVLSNLKIYLKSHTMFSLKLTGTSKRMAFIQRPASTKRPLKKLRSFIKPIYDYTKKQNTSKVGSLSGFFKNKLLISHSIQSPLMLERFKYLNVLPYSTLRNLILVYKYLVFHRVYATHIINMQNYRFLLHYADSSLPFYHARFFSVTPFNQDLISYLFFLKEKHVLKRINKKSNLDLVIYVNQYLVNSVVTVTSKRKVIYTTSAGMMGYFGRARRMKFALYSVLSQAIPFAINYLKEIRHTNFKLYFQGSVTSARFIVYRFYKFLLRDFKRTLVTYIRHKVERFIISTMIHFKQILTSAFLVKELAIKTIYFRFLYNIFVSSWVPKSQRALSIPFLLVQKQQVFFRRLTRYKNELLYVIHSVRNKIIQMSTVKIYHTLKIPFNGCKNIKRSVGRYW